VLRSTDVLALKEGFAEKEQCGNRKAQNCSC
jgi:hypothetical protein